MIKALVVSIGHIELVFASMDEYDKYINRGQLPVHATKMYVSMDEEEFNERRLFKFSEFNPVYE